jgi:hypothetical protein
MTAPLRGQPGAAVREQHSVVPLHGSPMPSDPAQLLAARQPHKPRGGKTRIMLIGTGVLVVAQLFAPPPLKPTAIAGQAVASFSAPTIWTGTDAQADLEYRRGLAARLAKMESDYADSRAKCFWGVLLSPEAGQMCTQLVDANYAPAIHQIRAQLGR